MKCNIMRAKCARFKRNGFILSVVLAVPLIILFSTTLRVGNQFSSNELNLFTFSESEQLNTSGYRTSRNELLDRVHFNAIKC
jgi:hypothetical protein